MNVVRNEVGADAVSIGLFRFLLVFLFITIFLYLYIISLYALNIPFLDDFNDILRFLVKFNEAETIGDMRAAFFEQHSQPPHVDHRTMASRLIYLAVFKLQGVIDFKVLAYAANLSLLLLVYGLWQGLTASRYRLFWVALIVAVLLDIRHYTLITWPMSAFAFYCSYGYGLLAIMFLSKGTKASFLWAVLLSILATFSLVSGILVWPVGLVVILYTALLNNRPPWLVSIVWISIAAVVLSFFFTDYNSSVSGSKSLGHALNNALFVARLFLTMAGSQFSFGSVLAAELVGAVMISMCIYIVLTTRKCDFTHLHFFLLYVILSIGLVVAGRAYASTIFDAGLEFALLPRYSFGSKVLTVTLLALLANRVDRPRKAHMLFAILGVSAIWIANFIFYQPELEKRYQQRVEHYNVHGIKFSHSKYFKEEAPLYADKAIDGGLYLPPTDPDAMQ